LIEIADRPASLAQLLSSQKENPYKVKVYQRAAARIRNLSESLDEMVHDHSSRSGCGFALQRHKSPPWKTAQATSAAVANHTDSSGPRM